MQRIETWPVPMPALREAVLNAVVHKDYASSATIQISVYPDKLMIWNPGELPADWTVEKLLGKHASIPFNPDIASVFFRAGLIESWGRGIEKILEACREAGTPEPELRHEPSGLWVTFHFLPADGDLRAGETARGTPVEPPVKAPEMTVKTPVKTRMTVKTPVETAGTPVETTGMTVETTVEMTVETPAKAKTTVEKRVLEVLRKKPHMTLVEVAKEIGKSRRTVERLAVKLAAEGRLRYVGPRKGGHWETLE